MANVTILPPDIGSGRIYLGDLEGEKELAPMAAKTPEERQAQAEATAAYFRRIDALRAERAAEMERGKLPFEDIPGVYNWQQEGAGWRGGIDPKAMEAAAQAVEASERFQGIRGYQQALADGKSPADAMRTYMPMIFSNGKSAGSAAAAVLKSDEPLNIGGVGYARVPGANGLLPQITPPKPVAQIEERETEGGRVLIARQPSGAVTFKTIPAHPDPMATDLRNQATKAQDEFERAKMGVAKARSVAVVDGEEVPAAKPEQLAQAEAALNAAGTRLSQARKRLDSHLAAKRGPVVAAPNQPPGQMVAPATDLKPVTQQAAKQALLEAKGDRAKARQILIDARYKVD